MLRGASWTPGGTSCSVTCSRSPRFAGAFTLRQRMLNFVQNIQYYMMFEVMEPTWHVLEKNLKSVSSQSALTLKRLCANRPCLQRGGRWLRCQSLCRGSSAPGGGSQACTRVCNEAVWVRARGCVCGRPGIEPSECVGAMPSGGVLSSQSGPSTPPAHSRPFEASA